MSVSGCGEGVQLFVLCFVLSSYAFTALEVNFVRLLQLENTWLVGSPGDYPLPILCNTNPPFSI